MIDPRDGSSDEGVWPWKAGTTVAAKFVPPAAFGIFNGTVTSGKDVEPLTASLRHRVIEPEQNVRQLRNEAADFLREVMIPTPATITYKDDGGEEAKHYLSPGKIEYDGDVRLRVEVAIMILKELGCPPTG